MLLSIDADFHQEKVVLIDYVHYYDNNNYAVL